MAISVSFPFSWAAQPGAWGKPLWVLVFSTTSHSNWSGLQTAWLPVFTELYNSSTPTQSSPTTGHRNMHFHRLWNSMFDRHRAEITVMQFTGNSLPVHQFVTVPWDFNPVPYCQPSSPMPMEYALLRLWNGMFGRVEGQYTSKGMLLNSRALKSLNIWENTFDGDPSSTIVSCYCPTNTSLSSLVWHILNTTF